MLRRLKPIIGYAIQATDDKVGHVKDFFFDDQVWAVRYVVVDTGKWLPGRRVLISPQAVGAPDDDNNTLPVDLTVEQIENSPPIEVDEPVGLHHEEAMAEYYGWARYWLNSESFTRAALPSAGDPEERGYSDRGVAANPYKPTTVDDAGLDPQAASLGGGPEEVEAIQEAAATPDPHLRNAHDVLGYAIGATDGNIGVAYDLIVDPASWVIRYLVVDTGKWLPGRKVLVAPSWVSSINWSEEEMNLTMTQEEIRNSPEYDPHAEISRAYEEELHDHYSKPTYW